MASGGAKQTSTTTIPQWMQDAGKQNYNDARAYNQANPITPYTGQLSAPQNANVTQAGTVAANAVGTGQSQVNAGTSAAQQAGAGHATQSAGPGSFTSAGIASQYMNPYVQQVQQNTLREMGRQATINQNSVNDAAGAAKAFGGDRHGIVASEQAKNDAQRAADYIDQSNAAAYQSGQQQFNTEQALNQQNNQFNSSLSAGDLDRLLSSAGILGQLGSTASGIASGDTSRLLQTGLASQDISQQADDAAYQEYLRQQNAPMDRYSQIGGILSGTPYSSSTTQKSPGSPINTLLGLGGIAASIFSDKRLKDNIVATGDEWHGLPVFEFDYRKDMDVEGVPDGRHRGVMAQDAILKYPDAVSVDSSGYLQIDYGHIAHEGLGG